MKAIVSSLVPITAMAACSALAILAAGDDATGTRKRAADPRQPGPASTSSIVRRADTTPLRRTNGTSVGRVERDQGGHVTALLLSEMQLSSKEIQEIAALPQLRRLVLYRTNLADKDLRQLRRCTLLEHLNLTDTSITDASIDELVEFKKLESLCLGNVDISADAIARLKQEYESRRHVVKLGYSGRTR